jgi:hypothetical protein
VVKLLKYWLAAVELSNHQRRINNFDDDRKNKKGVEVSSGLITTNPMMNTSSGHGTALNLG